MPIVLHDDRFDVVIQHLQMRSSGATIRDIQALFTPSMNERTAQRMLSDLVTLGMLTKSGYGGTLRYQLRTKPGAFGRVLWFHPDSAGAAAVAPPPEEPVQHRKPRPKPAGGAATPPSPNSPATPPSPHGTPVSPSRATAARTAKVAAVVPTATAPASDRAPSSLNPQRSTSRPAPATQSFDVQRSMFDVGRSAAARSAAAPLPPKFATLFASSVPRIIPVMNDRNQAELALQTDAAIEGLTPPEMKAYMPAALAQLDALTAEQAARYRITADQYAAWRKVYPIVQA